MQIPDSFMSGQLGLQNGDMDDGIFETPARIETVEPARLESQISNKTPPPTRLYRGRELTIETTGQA
jgi:hypothetical protein